MSAGTRDGGKPEVKPLPYSPPKGPQGINDPKEPGIHGSNLGNSGTQHK